MKKLLIVLIIIFLIVSSISTLSANGDVYVNTSNVSIVRGSSTTIRITANNCAGKIAIYSQNTSIASVNASSEWMDNDSLTVRINGNKNGTTNIVVEKVDVTSTDEKAVTGKIYIKVNVYTPVSNNTGLEAISIEGIEIEQLEDLSYVAYAPLGTTNLDIKVTPASNKAKASVIDSSLIEGWNDKSFTITAENGESQKYPFKIYVEEKPTIFYNKLGVVKNLDKVVIPEGFEKEEIQVNSETITVLNNKKLNLIYLIDENNEKAYYLYDLEKNEVISKYEPILIDNKQYLRTNLDFENYPELQEDYYLSNISIDENSFECLKSKATNMNDFCLVKLINQDGEKELYSYDIKEKTLQRFVLPIYNKTDNTQLYMAIAISSAIAGVALLIGSLFVVLKKKQN